MFSGISKIEISLMIYSVKKQGMESIPCLLDKEILFLTRVNIIRDFIPPIVSFSVSQYFHFRPLTSVRFIWLTIKKWPYRHALASNCPWIFDEKFFCCNPGVCNFVVAVVVVAVVFLFCCFRIATFSLADIERKCF